MTDALEQSQERPKNPALDVLGWIQKQVFTHPQAYYHEGYNQKIIDQTWGNPGVFLWVGLNNEGGVRHTVKDVEGNEHDAVEMAHVTIERSDEDGHHVETRWLKVMLDKEAPKVHMHRLVTNIPGGDAEWKDYRFLEEAEIDEVYQELMGMESV